MVETHGPSRRREKPVDQGTEFGGRRNDRVRFADVLAARAR